MSWPFSSNAIHRTLNCHNATLILSRNLNFISIVMLFLCVVEKNKTKSVRSVKQYVMVHGTELSSPPHAVVILTSASIVGVLRYTVTRSRRRRQLERYSQDRRRNNDASRSLQEEVSVSGHSQPDHDHDQQYQQSKLPAIVIQPDGHTVDFAVEEDMMEGGQKEDRPDPVRRNNTRRPFLVTVEVLNSGADHESSEKDPSTQDVK